MAATLLQPVLPDTPPRTPGGEEVLSFCKIALTVPPTRPDTPPVDPQGEQASNCLIQWAEWGLDRPLSALMREATALAHEKVQRAPIVE